MEELEDIVNKQTYTQNFRLEAQTKKLTPFQLIRSYIMATKRPEEMTQAELVAEAQRLKDYKDKLGHPSRIEFVETSPKQWGREDSKRMSAAARAFAIKVVNELRKLAGE